MERYHNSKMPGLLMREHRIQFAAYHTYADNPKQSKKSELCDFAENNISSCSFGDTDDDVIDFLAEEAEPQGPRKATLPWKILIADDDINVHDTTILALTGVQIHNRPLELMHAYPAKEAQEVLLATPDTSLVLLDVVRETVDPGLKLVSV